MYVNLIDAHERILKVARYQIRDLKIEKDNEKIVLRGWCKNYYSKQLISAEAKKNFPNFIIENEMVVI